MGLPGVINYLGVGFACGALHKSFSRQETLKLVSGVWRTIFAVREGRDFTQEELAKREASERGVLANIYNGVPLETEGLAQMSYLKYFYGLERAALLMNTMASFGIVDSGLNWLHSTKTNPYDPVDLAIASRYYKPPQILKEWLLENSKQPRGPGN